MFLSSCINEWKPIRYPWWLDLWLMIRSATPESVCIRRWNTSSTQRKSCYGDSWAGCCVLRRGQPLLASPLTLETNHAWPRKLLRRHRSPNDFRFAVVTPAFCNFEGWSTLLAIICSMLMASQFVSLQISRGGGSSHAVCRCDLSGANSFIHFSCSSRFWIFVFQLSNVPNSIWFDNRLWVKSRMVWIALKYDS